MLSGSLREGENMASAKKCDRCGDFYTEKESNVFNDATTALQRLAEALSPICPTKTREQQVIETVLDLCPKCSKSLTNWLWRKDDKKNG